MTAIQIPRRIGRRRSRGALLVRLAHKPVVLVAALVGVGLIATTILVPLLVGRDPEKSNLLVRLKSPSWLGGVGLFGTDSLGRDIFLRCVYGLRTTYFVGISAVLLAVTIGTTIGLISGYFGGKTDAVLMRIAEIQLSMPALLIVLIFMRVFENSLRTLIIVLGIGSWVLYARVIRGAVLAIRQSELVSATTSLGATVPRILFVHILPNIAPSAISLMAVDFARIMLAEAALSFLGLGVPFGVISLGGVLSDGRLYQQTAWWMSTFSGLVLLLAVLSTNLVGQWFHQSTGEMGSRL